MLSGLNHLTLSVHNLPQSIDFYHRLLGMKLEASWDAGAYLSLPHLWICLTLDPRRHKQAGLEYTHYAFSISADKFKAMVSRLHTAQVIEWQTNQSEGDSFYFLDPNGHKLEIHVGDLASRLAKCHIQPYKGMKIYSHP